MIYPPYLKAGDTIGIVCPSGYMPKERVNKAVETLNEWGFQVRLGKTVGHQYHYFSGTDDERLQDLQRMIDDSSIHAILCGRGGYGFTRIIDQIDFSAFIKNPKWIIGFSDITILHAHLLTQYNISSIHGPMAGAFTDYGSEHLSIQSLHKVLLGEKINYTVDAHILNKTGKIEGKLIGGNLSLLAHLIGTKSDLIYKDAILFIEDIGEYLYHIDRMLWQLKRSNKLSQIKALIVGGFTEMKDTIIPFGKSVYEIIDDVIKEFDFPVCFNFPVSHSEYNMALKYGSFYSLHITNNNVSLIEK